LLDAGALSVHLYTTELKMTIGIHHFCAKNEYTDGQFLAGRCGSWQWQVADGADVVFTDTQRIMHCIGDDSDAVTRYRVWVETHTQGHGSWEISN